jgi:hypothetical protein
MQDREYTVLRREFLADPKNKCCNAKLPGCTGSNPSNLTVHHTRGRGRYYLDVSTWMCACMSCHHWIEEHPEESRELGFTDSRGAKILS